MEVVSWRRWRKTTTTTMMLLELRLVYLGESEQPQLDSSPLDAPVAACTIQGQLLEPLAARGKRWSERACLGHECHLYLKDNQKEAMVEDCGDLLGVPSMLGVGLDFLKMHNLKTSIHPERQR